MPEPQEEVAKRKWPTRMAAARKKMLDNVQAGWTPKVAAKAAGVSEDWESDPAFRGLVDQIEAECKGEIEGAYFKYLKDNPEKVTQTERALFLKARCGWNEKEGESQFQQNITLVYQEVDGTQPPAEGDKNGARDSSADAQADGDSAL